MFTVNDFAFNSNITSVTFSVEAFEKAIKLVLTFKVAFEYGAKSK